MENHQTIRAKSGGWAERARRLRVELYALYLATRHPLTPWYAKLVVAGFVAYAVTPVDLVPDFIPVIGLIDDLIFVPIAIALAVRFVPDAVLVECRARAQQTMIASRSGWWIALALWVLLAGGGLAAALMAA
jgi:uncharacterized membrane protein YkvA (DUF1232 family)